MYNDTNTIEIVLPVGAAVVKNVTQNFETHLFNMLLHTFQHMNVPGRQYNILTIVLILCLTLMIAVLYLAKHRHRFLRRRANIPLVTSN